MPTPFATLGIPVTTLAGVTDLSAGVLGFGTALQLIIPCIILPFFLVMLAGGGLRAVKGVGLITLIAGLSLAAPILLVTRFLGPELPALLGSFCTIGCIALANKHLYKDTAHNRQFHIDVSPSAYISTAASISDISAAKANALPAAGSDKPLMSVPQACLPFAIVLVIMLITRLIGPVYRTLSNVKADMIAYSGPGAYVLSFTFLLTPGLLILISVFLASVMQGYRISALWHIIKSSVIESKNMAITIISIVAMAKIMVYSGMTGAIALMLIAAFSVFYPLAAPVIGLFGVFITGSNTSCAILFGHLQASAARAIGASPPWIVSSNMSGAALGKMISPQSIAIGLRIGGLDGEEGAIIRQTLKYSLFCVAIVCVITYIFV